MDSERIEACQNSSAILLREPQKDPRFLKHWRSIRLALELFHVVRKLRVEEHPRDAPAVASLCPRFSKGCQPMDAAGFLKGAFCKAHMVEPVGVGVGDGHCRRLGYCVSAPHGQRPPKPWSHGGTNRGSVAEDIGSESPAQIRRRIVPLEPGWQGIPASSSAKPVRLERLYLGALRGGSGGVGSPPFPWSPELAKWGLLMWADTIFLELRADPRQAEHSVKGGPHEGVEELGDPQEGAARWGREWRQGDEFRGGETALGLGGAREVMPSVRPR